MNENAPGIGEVRSRIDQARAKMQEKAKAVFSDSKNQVSDSLGGVAQAFRQTGEQLRNQNYGSVAGYADQAASRIEKVSGYLHDKNVDELLDEAESLARKQPILTVAGAFALGFILARAVKGTSTMH